MPKTPPVVDMHIHLGPMLLGEDYARKFDTLEQKAILEASGVAKAVSLELVWDDSYLRLREKLAPAGDFFELFPSVDVSRLEEPDFDGLVYRTFRDYKADGIKGLKLWKNITLDLRDKAGNALRVDSSLFKPVFAYSAEFNLPIVIHIGDPPSFFEPVTPDNEYYQSLLRFPEWSFYKPGVASFKEHLDMQERMIADNPKTQFVVAHVGGYAEDTRQVSRWLDLYPNMYVDIAARVFTMGRDPAPARELFLKHPDRILFGTDYCPPDDGETMDAEEFYNRHYKFLETSDENLGDPFASEVRKRMVTGVNLPQEILEQVYRGNAKRILGLSY